MILPNQGSAPGLDSLTPREQDIARIAMTGASTREIAVALCLSPKTIETNLTRIYRKIGVRSKAQLAHQLTALV